MNALESLKQPVTRSREFLEECWAELKKVHFPTRKETQAATIAVILSVTIVAARVSSRVGQCTFFSSAQHSSRNSRERSIGRCSVSRVVMGFSGRVRQGSNLQPPDLESGALPIRATDPQAPGHHGQTFPSLCSTWLRQKGQYLRNASFSVVFFLFLVVV